jgi:hypothetical protein
MAEPCGWMRRRRAEEVVTGAFLEAMREFGIAEHSNGECPAPGCRCDELADQIEARAVEITAAKLGVPVPELGPVDG